MATPIVMPKQGNTVEECLLSEWRVKEGDAVSEGDVIAAIETDKATFEVESTASGTILALFWEEGDLVPVLQNICAVGEAGEDVSSLRPDGAAADAPAQPAASDEADVESTDVSAVEEAAGVPAASAGVQAPMSPRAKKFIAEHPFVVPETLAGSGAGGRIIEQDVRKAFEASPRLTPTAAAMRDAGVAVPASGSGVGGAIVSGDMGKQAPAPVVEAVEPAAVKETKLSNIRKIIASRMHDSLASTAQYTLNAEADVTGLLQLRKQIKQNGEKLGLANVNIGDMVMFATMKALLKHPEVNAEFTGDAVRQHSAVHLAFACDTPRGLMVPVVHNADRMSLADLSAQVRKLAGEANSGSLNPDFLSGGTFTVSNLGAFGVTTFTPVINAPQVGILGVGTTVLRPVRSGDDIVYRDFMQFSLTLNHMIVDGAPGARFLQTLIGIVENFGLVCVAG